MWENRNLKDISARERQELAQGEYISRSQALSGSLDNSMEDLGAYDRLRLCRCF
jgi:hypothetical protein